MPNHHRPSVRGVRVALSTAAALVAVAAGAPEALSQAATHAVIPVPVSVQLGAGAGFVVDGDTPILIAADAPAGAERVAAHLGEVLRPRAAKPRRLATGADTPSGAIVLRAGTGHGAEGYRLDVAAGGVTIEATGAAGLFYGVQTLRQLLPAAVEHPAAIGRTLTVPAGRIEDRPRFAWRGAMLDVSRHFLEAEDVKRYVDLMALYKMNRLHLHLSDDQGWRIEIRSWPNLARHGGRSEVGGGEGGYYTQEQYADLVAYAAERHVTIVPEIDMPGHTNAALSSYAELNCDGVAPPPYTGTRVGFSTVCPEREDTWRFVDDVVRELAALTPGEFIHLGGDEVEKLTPAQYRGFVERAEGIVRKHGKRMIGWGEIAVANLDASTVAQHWKRDSSALHARRGGSVILSPSSRVYLDMKYDDRTVTGLKWAALIEVRDAYDWEPAELIPGLAERSILGVEAPLWSETLERYSDFEFQAFPRLIGVAELGWSARERRGWDDFRRRLGLHGPRLQALGVNFYRSPQVEWAR